MGNGAGRLAGPIFLGSLPGSAGPSDSKFSLTPDRQFYYLQSTSKPILLLLPHTNKESHEDEIL
jgi:hypothetical protein